MSTGEAVTREVSCIQEDETRRHTWGKAHGQSGKGRPLHGEGVTLGR